MLQCAPALLWQCPSLAPTKDGRELFQWITYAKNPLVGLLVRVEATAFLLSSSVVVGIEIIAVQQALLVTADVVPIVFGSNIDATSTALIASFGMSHIARRCLQGSRFWARPCGYSIQLKADLEAPACDLMSNTLC